MLLLLCAAAARAEDATAPDGRVRVAAIESATAAAGPTVDQTDSTEANGIPHASPTAETATTEFAGTVTDRLTRDPISGATVMMMRGKSITSEPEPAVTDGQGRFVVTDIRPGVYGLMVVANGYRTRLWPIVWAVGPEPMLVIDVQMRPPLGLLASLSHVGAVPACLAALLAMSVVFAAVRHFWLPLPSPSVGVAARAALGLGAGLLVGPSAALLACAVIRLVSTAGPALPDGVLFWARYAGYGAIGVAGFGVAPVVGLVTAISARVAVAPARAATVAACGGLAAALSLCRSAVRYGWHEYLGTSTVCRLTGGPAHLSAAHMVIVCVAVAAVTGVVGVSASLLIRGLTDRLSRPGV
jgi:hypothetical protein